MSKFIPLFVIVCLCLAVSGQRSYGGQRHSTSGSNQVGFKDMAGDFVCKLFKTQSEEIDRQLKSVKRSVDDLQELADQLQEAIYQQKKELHPVNEIEEVRKQINDILVYLKAIYETQNQDPNTNSMISMFTRALITRFEIAKDQIDNKHSTDYFVLGVDYDVELMMDQIERLRSSVASSEELKKNLKKALGNRDC